MWSIKLSNFGDIFTRRAETSHKWTNNVSRWSILCGDPLRPHTDIVHRSQSTKHRTTFHLNKFMIRRKSSSALDRAIVSVRLCLRCSSFSNLITISSFFLSRHSPARKNEYKKRPRELEMGKKRDREEVTSSSRGSIGHIISESTFNEVNRGVPCVCVFIFAAPFLATDKLKTDRYPTLTLCIWYDACRTQCLCCHCSAVHHVSQGTPRIHFWLQRWEFSFSAFSRCTSQTTAKLMCNDGDKITGTLHQANWTDTCFTVFCSQLTDIVTYAESHNVQKSLTAPMLSKFMNLIQCITRLSNICVNQRNFVAIPMMLKFDDHITARQLKESGWPHQLITNGLKTDPASALQSTNALATQTPHCTLFACFLLHQIHCFLSRMERMTWTWHCSPRCSCSQWYTDIIFILTHFDPPPSCEFHLHFTFSSMIFVSRQLRLYRSIPMGLLTRQYDEPSPFSRTSNHKIKRRSNFNWTRSRSISAVHRDARQQTRNLMPAADLWSRAA